jgi:prepilin-type N-terminal cleavage/methylation domain
VKGKNFKLDNKGFSLVELIVGVTILVLVASPMLQTFVTSAKTTAKSRENRNATLAVQNVVENIALRSIPRLILDVKNGTDTSLWGIGSTTEVNFYSLNADGDYSVIDANTVKSGEDEYYIGLKKIESGKSDYDCMVKFDAMADEYRGKNEVPLAKYTNMDGVYSQPFDVDENPDTQAAAYFVDMATVLAGVAVADDYFDDIMERKIVITVEKTPDSEGATTGILSASVEFIYTATYGTEPLEKSYTTEFYHSAYDEADEGLEALYLFYYPMYSTTDNITIYNMKNVKFNMFLIKQKILDTTDSEISIKENTYKAKLLVHEGMGSVATEACAKISSNLNVNLITEAPIIPTSNFVYQLYKGAWYSNFTITGQLVAKEPENRIYKVQADLYDEGQNFADDSHIFTFETSSTNYN